MKYYFVSDVHGEYDKMVAALNASGFDPQKDTIVSLGDAIDRGEKSREVVEYLLSCPNRILIMGNHDQSATKFKSYFNEIYTGPLFIAEKILLSHEPIVSGSTWYNIHGHDHNPKKLPWEKDNFMDYWNEINLASNVVNYQVFNLGKAIKDGLLSYVDGVHRLTIDKASGRK